MFHALQSITICASHYINGLIKALHVLAERVGDGEMCGFECLAQILWLKVCLSAGSPFEATYSADLRQPTVGRVHVPVCKIQTTVSS